MSGTRPVRVVAVAPVHNRRDTTLRWLRALASLDLAGLDLTTIVVDDGSTDGTAGAIRREFPLVEIVPGDGTLWFTAGTNRGVEAALAQEPDYILAMNDDAVPDRGLLASLVATAERNPRSVVGGLLLLKGEKGRVVQVGAEWGVHWGGWRHWLQQTVDTVPRVPFEVQILVGNCVLFPAGALRECGLMDERHLPHHGDAELTPRMRRAGWRLLVDPGARVICEPGRTYPSLGTLPLREVWRHLIVDRTSQHNLRTRAFTNWRVAPTRARGIAATAVFVARVALRRLGLSKSFPPHEDGGALRDRLPPGLSAAPAGGARPLVVYAWPYLDWGGVQIYFLNLMKRLRGRFEVRAVVPLGTDPVLLAWLAEAGVSVETFPAAYGSCPAAGIAGKLRNRLVRFRTDAALARRLLAPRFRGALVHADVSPYVAASFFVILTRFRNVFFTMHTATRPPWSFRTRLSALAVNVLARSPRLRLVATNGDAKVSLARTLSPRELARVPVSYGNTDPSEIEAALAAPLGREALAARLGLPPAACRVFAVGQFLERKGCWDLLEAARLLDGRGVDAGFVWLANRAPAEDVLKHIEGFGLGARFRFLTPGDFGARRLDALVLLRVADVFALPSHEEGLPLALTEAMCLGLACVSTSVNGIPEAIADGRSGRLVPPRRPDLLADALEELARDPGRRAALGAEARRSAWNRFASDESILATLRAYDEALTA
ncbi:MAG: glycosyltransferase [Thermoanaerobaculia bacterium]|nr:glycosyltransferase [Thermoanaerobaculia bacterium]